ncbi:FAD-binding oxidoreductase [Heliobacterium mobile]|nr:FAD-binding oxidoreductase [Heliobacterium mobile]
MTQYNRITPEILKQLIFIVGAKYVIIDQERMGPYTHDETADPELAHHPEVVLLPENTQQVAEIVKLANHHKLPIVPRGAGTGLSGGIVPKFGGIVISLERFDKIIEIDSENMFMTVEAGVITERVQEAANRAGFLYAGDPCSGHSSTIGGNVATNAGGNKVLKYGSTRRQVYGLEVVTAEGDIVFLGGKCMKDSTGYSLLNLIIGSEGTLGIITKVILKLQPLPSHRVDLLAIFPDRSSAMQAVPLILQKGIIPAALEFMDNRAVQCCEEYIGEKLPYRKDAYYLIVTLEGDDEGFLEGQMALIDEVCRDSGVIEILAADPRRIWRARRVFAEASRARSPVYSGEDLVVPLSALGVIIKFIVDRGEEYGVTIHCAGHAGDGNVHAHILKDSINDDNWRQILLALHDQIYKKVYSLGGKLSGEHGIGYKRVKLLEEFCHPVELKMMKAIKQCLDPNLILNPGKVLQF